MFSFIVEVQKAIPQRSGNVTFFKKVGLEKGGSKYLVSLLNFKSLIAFLHRGLQIFGNCNLLIE